MGNKKKAKYKVGDTVVITMYGTVGKITDVIFLFLLVQNHVFMIKVGELKHGFGSNLFALIKKRGTIGY